METLMEILKAPELQVLGQGVREGRAIGLVSEELPSPACVRESSLAARFDTWVEDQDRRRGELAATLDASLELEASAQVREALPPGGDHPGYPRSIDFFDRHEQGS